MTTLLRRIPFLLVLMLAFGAGYLLHTPDSRTHAGGGYAAHVLTLKEDAGPAAVVADPDGDPTIVVVLRPGDRVLRTRGAIAVLDEGVYIPVYTATGIEGWLLDGEAITEEINPVFTTGSAMGEGARLRVKDEGAGTLCYSDPTFQSEDVHTLNTDTDITITGPPYQAELGLWWPVQVNDADICWIYDTPEHFAVMG